MDANIATVKYRPSLASATNPPNNPRRLRVPMKLVTIVADFDDERCRSPTKYVTKFIEIPITHTLSANSVPTIKRRKSFQNLAHTKKRKNLVQNLHILT